MKSSKNSSGAGAADCGDTDVENDDDDDEDTDDALSLGDASTSSGVFTAPGDDCSQISSFFGYWKNLINQEAKFQGQLNELSKQLSTKDAETAKLRFHIEEMERDVFAKTAGIERLQMELDSAQKDAETSHTKLETLESELNDFRAKNHQLNTTLKEYTDFQQQLEHLKQHNDHLQLQISQMEVQLQTMQIEKTALEAEKEQIQQMSEEKLNEVDIKWRQDFEKLRTLNLVKEQQLLDDFEWKLREVQQSCKRKLEQDQERIEILKELEELREFSVQEQSKCKDLELANEKLKLDEDTLRTDVRRLRSLVEIEKENCQHMLRRHQQELCDKERHIQQSLHQKRIEIAMVWEERLLTECARLKNELEQIHLEEKQKTLKSLKRDHQDEVEKLNMQWELRVEDDLKEIEALKKSLKAKDEYYREEISRTQTSTDRDIIELRRLMDKIDMTHHERFEKLVEEHDLELEKINKDWEDRLVEFEQQYQKQISDLKSSISSQKERFELESEKRIENLIEQHREELENQWENLIRQKSEAIELVQEEYKRKYGMLEEQLGVQQKSHNSREVDLLKTIDSLKNELNSKSSTIEDLQSNCDTLEGAIQVLNEEIAQQNNSIGRLNRETVERLRELEKTVAEAHDQQQKERESSRLKLSAAQKRSQETIDHLHRKCQCLTKLFEEIRQRYERRESRKEDLNTITDLKQMIAEQEKDLSCINEEKRYYQMRLMALLNNGTTSTGEGDEVEYFEDAAQDIKWTEPLSIPPTIPECDE